MKLKVSVKSLAEFVHQRGDLYPPLDGRTRAEEGIETQRRIQQKRPAGYQREYSVSHTLSVSGIELAISGRVDGYQPSEGLVEEIKTTRADPEATEAFLGSSHWAQLTLYAALLAIESSGAGGAANAEQATAAAKTAADDQQAARDSWRMMLTYCHPDDDREHSLYRTVSAQDLNVYLQDTVDVYARWQRRQADYRQLRDRWLEQRTFPFAEYRQHQRALARRVFQTVRNGESLLLEAPTGSGKTLGVIYPALKALSAGHVDRVFYLTSRSTGAIAARDASELIHAPDAPLRTIELIAKEKACPVPDMPCRSDQCAYARGYYDRRGDAIAALLETAMMTPAATARVSEAFMVCPFELSLDAALWADLIIGDYNYVFDPVVRLQRFIDDDRMALLIDECHQLTDRGRSMLSLELTRRALKRAIQEAPPAPLLRRLRGLDRALLSLRREASLGAEQPIAEPVAVLRAIQRVMDALGEEELELTRYPDCLQLIFNLSRWQRADAWRDNENFQFFGTAENGRGGSIRDITLRLACLDPGPYLASVMAGYGPHVRFSGTVTPLPVYQRLHGVPEAPYERVASLFQPEQLGLFVVTGLSVLYRDRVRSLPDLVELIVATVNIEPGNYLIALPSFEYLEQLSSALEARAAPLDLLLQTRSMTMDERSEFLDAFTPDSRRLGLVVLGGVFAESVDFAGADLKGVLCVGLGLPPAEPVREAIAGRFAADAIADGETVAYQQPAMQKILQMAGRLLRGPADRGIVCLIDGRFLMPAYQRFFPVHWHPQPVSAEQLPVELEKFWQGGRALPRLAAPEHTA